MSEKVKIGDVVKLKSGGVPMTVTGVRFDEGWVAQLTWHDVHGQSCGDEIPMQCLVVQPQ